MLVARVQLPAATAYAAAVLLVAAATALCALGRQVFGLPDLVMVYLLAIMMVAAWIGRGPALLAAALSVAAYDFFFVPPYFTFAVAEPSHLLTFVTMFVVGALISGLALRLRRQEAEAATRAERMTALYELSRQFVDAADEREVMAVIARRAAESFHASAAVLLREPDGEPRLAAHQGEVPFEAAERAIARWVFESGRPAGLGTRARADARIACYPLRSVVEVVGLLVLAPPDTAASRPIETPFLDSFLRQSAIAVERARLFETARAATLRARTEEMRSSLLSTVSHDLRTPLAAITGAASTLRDGEARLEGRVRADLLATICEEAFRMERLIANLLDMTRLESGDVQVRREWVPLEEIIGAALTRVEVQLGARPVHIDLAADLPLLSADPVLLQQLLVNLLENAARYTPADSPLELRAAADDDRVTLEIADRGPGIAAGEEARIFEKFQRGRSAGGASAPPGLGLGLPICRAIVEAHGGTIRVENRGGGGARFRIAMPRLVGAPALPPPAGALPLVAGGTP